MREVRQELDSLDEEMRKVEAAQAPPIDDAEVGDEHAEAPPAEDEAGARKSKKRSAAGGNGSSSKPLASMADLRARKTALHKQLSANRATVGMQ